MSTLAAMLAYICDVSTVQKRTLRLSIAEGLLAVAVVIGAGGGGVAVRHYGLTPVIIASIAGQMIAFFYTAFFLQESVQQAAIGDGEHFESN